MRLPGCFTQIAPAAGLNRRRWLQLSSLGWLSAGGLGRSAVSRAAPAPPPASSRAKSIRSCILIFHYGGPSQIETFDPKPLAPAEVRGEYATIETAAPGVEISDHLPNTARLMDRVSLIRTMHHPMRNHNSAAAEMLTGRTPVSGDLELLADEARSYPTLGSAVNYGLRDRAHVLPYVALPYTMYNVVQLPGQTPGILGGAYDRFQMQGDPNAADFKLSALDPPGARAGREIQAREALLRQLDGMRPAGGPLAKMQNYQERALQLIASEPVRRGFDIGQERPETRARYGRNLLGQSVLLARRLVEEGVNFVSVFNGQHNGQEANWDSHVNLFPRHGQLLPPADLAYSALIEDLETRGLLDSTLVVWLAEFGRTPKINKSAGRDHWPDCYTVALAGGGVQGGSVYGASDKIAAYPDRDPVSPADLAATIFWRFGVDPNLEMHDQTNRPFRLAEGQPLYGLFG
jgi:Protein of unknown function (DUF1501)